MPADGLTGIAAVEAEARDRLAAKNAEVDRLWARLREIACQTDPEWALHLAKEAVASRDDRASKLVELLNEQTKWLAEPRWGEPVSPWYPVFLLAPRRMWDGRWRWLCRVDRRLIQARDGLDPRLGSWFQYRVREATGDGK